MPVMHRILLALYLASWCPTAEARQPTICRDAEALRVEREHVEWLNARVGRAAAREKKQRTCKRIAGGLPDAAAFARLRLLGQPIVFTDAWSIFGEEVASWRNVTRLSDLSGDVKAEASRYPVTPGERFGIAPSADGGGLLHPFKQEASMEDVIRFDDPTQMLCFEPLPLYGHEDGFSHRRLWPHVQQPDLAAWMDLKEAHLWIGRMLAGGRPKESPTHFDPYDNLYLLLRGRKQFLMYDAADSANLHTSATRAYKRPSPEAEALGHRPTLDGTDVDDNRAPINPLRPDTGRYPRQAQAQLINCTLAPGEALYMPAFTWHNVLSLAEYTEAATSDGVAGQAADRGAPPQFNVAINVWYESDARFQWQQEMLLELLQGPQCPPAHEIRDGESESRRMGDGDKDDDDEDDEEEEEDDDGEHERESHEASSSPGERLRKAEL